MKKTVVVENVHEFPGHIACSSESNSEIVIPILKDQQVVAVLDIDSKEFATFNSEDKLAFEKISKIISKLF
jgi:GAF domain-containing protein